jgi:hypothetical protein
MKLGFDLAIIEQLGEKLYTNLPPILAEYISNSYDADATEVIIDIHELSKNPYNYTIEIKDNGAGIGENSEIIEEKFLSFGRKKRIKEGRRVSEKFKRLYHGKKGVGKLAGFGCGRALIIDTIKNSVQNKFKIDLDKIEENIKNNIKEYSPEEIIKDKKIEKASSYTKIILERHTRKSKIDLGELANSIVQRLQIFDNSEKENKFVCKINYISSENNILNTISLENKMYFKHIIVNTEEDIKWDIRDILNTSEFDGVLSEEEKKFIIDNKINAEFYTSKTPLQNKAGIIVYCRNKLAEEKTFFVDRENDRFYSYLYGKIDADFIDEDDYQDHISTARININWEKVDPIFKLAMQKIIKKLQNSWRKKKQENKENELKNKFNIDLNNLVLTDNKAENLIGIQFAKKIADLEDITSEQLKDYIVDLENMFKFKTFKDIITEIVSSDISSLREDQILDYLKKWNVVEYSEYSKISVARLEALKVFEKMIENQESETKKIQPFLEKWPWLLDPRITDFQRERTYEDLLKKEYNESSLNEDDSNRRIDFYCTSGNGTIFIIELKRPGIKVDEKILQQASEYGTFIEECLKKKYITSEETRNIPSVQTILVVEPYLGKAEKGPQLYHDTIKTINARKSLVDSGMVIVQTYSALIKQAKKYNSDLIEKYEAFLNLKDEKKEL